MTDTLTDADPAAGFAALMNKAAVAADMPASEAPYGYKDDGTPKKAAGRPRRSPSVDELKAPEETAAAVAEGKGGPGSQPPPGPPSDRAPQEGKRRRRGGPKPPPEPVPAQPPSGVIARGVNKLYRRAGKIVRAMDSDTGTAILESARNTADPGEPDDSVGAAWEELAKTNPRIRKFLLKCIAGGAWGQLVMAHAPIAMAIIMKPAIFKLIPFNKFIASMAEPDEDSAPGEGGLPGGMTAGDAGQMAALAQQQMARMGLSVPPEVAEQMAAMAQSMMGGEPPGAPRAEQAPAFRRQQPRRAGTRAARVKAR